MHIFKNRSLPKQYVHWKSAAIACLCAGFVFLLEALTRLEIVLLGGAGFINLTIFTPIVCMLSVLCANRAQKNQYSISGLRWTTASHILLSIGLTLLFKSITMVGSDIFGGFNFLALVVMSCLLCIISFICWGYAKNFEVDINNE